jgi:hypothetical protein
VDQEVEQEHQQLDLLDLVVEHQQDLQVPGLQEHQVQEPQVEEALLLLEVVVEAPQLPEEEPDLVVLLLHVDVAQVKSPKLSLLRKLLNLAKK